MRGAGGAGGGGGGGGDRRGGACGGGDDEGETEGAAAWRENKRIRLLHPHKSHQVSLGALRWVAALMARTPHQSRPPILSFLYMQVPLGARGV